MDAEGGNLLADWTDMWTRTTTRQSRINDIGFFVSEKLRLHRNLDISNLLTDPVRAHILHQTVTRQFTYLVEETGYPPVKRSYSEDFVKEICKVIHPIHAFECFEKLLEFHRACVEHFDVPRCCENTVICDQATCLNAKILKCFALLLAKYRIHLTPPPIPLRKQCSKCLSEFSGDFFIVARCHHLLCEECFFCWESFLFLHKWVLCT